MESKVQHMIFQKKGKSTYTTQTAFEDPQPFLRPASRAIKLGTPKEMSESAPGHDNHKENTI